LCLAVTLPTPSLLLSFTTTPTTVTSTLSLHDALPICGSADFSASDNSANPFTQTVLQPSSVSVIPLYNPTRVNLAETFFVTVAGDRKSTRLNSSLVSISYAVFCLKKKNTVLTSVTHAA